MLVTIQEKGYTVAIDTKGAELKSFTNLEGLQYLWQADPTYWGKTSPVLFPNVGVLPDNQANIGGENYPLRRHGFARNMEFSVIQQSDTQVEFELISNEETLREYPFLFAFRIRYTLAADTLDICYTVENCGTDTMYYKIGGHPAFRCPLIEGESFSDYRIVFEKPEQADCPVMDVEKQQFFSSNRKRLLHFENSFDLNYDLFPHDALIFDRLQSKEVRLESKRSGRGVSMNFADFDTLGIWTPPNVQAPFVCLEPWCGSAVRYEMEDGTFERMHAVQRLTSGEEKQYHITISVF